jgi:hypothetical protein
VELAALAGAAGLPAAEVVLVAEAEEDSAVVPAADQAVVAEDSAGEAAADLVEVIAAVVG